MRCTVCGKDISDKDFLKDNKLYPLYWTSKDKTSIPFCGAVCSNEWSKQSKVEKEVEIKNQLT